MFRPRQGTTRHREDPERLQKWVLYHLIVVTAYPGSFAIEEGAANPLLELEKCLDALVPRQVAVHLLPFNPSDGDWGFAPNDWYVVDSAYGSWKDIRRIAQTRRLIVDGIYNHVGIHHPIAQSFLRSPSQYASLVHAFRREKLLVDVKSPRGGPAVWTHTLDGEEWHVWQTFSKASIDIRLDEPLVRAEVNRHMAYLARQGIWGLRLDAAAYYAKPDKPGEVQLHNPNAHRLTREIAAMAELHGLVVIAQLDCDENGAKYFPSPAYDVPIVDYSYSAHLSLALLLRDGRRIAAHIDDTRDMEARLIRAPRTHDGILLRSGLLDKEASSLLVRKAAEFGISARVIGGEPYELNCSLPYLYGQGTNAPGQSARIEMAVAISAFVPGWCFLYLPALLNYIPERQPGYDHDPRSLNRQSMPRSAWRDFVRSHRGRSMRRLLAYLAKIRATATKSDTAEVRSPGCFGGRVLVVDRPTDRSMLIANMDTKRTVHIGALSRGSLAESWRASDQRLNPLGFGFWHY